MDIAAAHAILEGAGGTVTNLKEDLKYGKSDIFNLFQQRVKLILLLMNRIIF